ncbi:MAG: TonB-dependent receptor [Candidatus Margulisiibacteriota bacterium]
MLKRIGLLCLLVLFCNAALALDAPRFYGEEVVVTAARLPQLSQGSPWNTSVITAEQLKPFRTVGEALRTVAGVDSQSYGAPGSLNAVRLRGANASQVVILLDGRRLNSPALGMVDLGDIATDDIERIEVVRAPLSAVYGSDAVSGAINIITKKPAAADRTLSVTTGSLGERKYRLALAGGNYSVNLASIRSDGFRRNGDYAATNVAGKVAAPLGIGEVAVDYAFYDADKGVPGVPTSETDPSSATEPSDRQKDQNTNVAVACKVGDYQLRAFQNTADQNLSPYIFGASRNQTWQTGLEFQQAIDSLVYGVEAREDRGRTTMAGDHTIRNYAVYAEDTFTVGRRYQLTASLRGDKHTTAGTSVNPRVGIAYQPSAGMTLRASAGTAFRAPTLNELYFNDGWMFGDTALKPERSQTYELGLERRLGGNSFAKLSYYATTVTDLILWDWQSSLTATRAKNIGQADMEGVEFELSRGIEDRGTAFVNYTYQKAVNKKDFDAAAVGKTIRYTPQNKYNVGVTLGGSSLLVKYVGERFADTYNTIVLPPYTVVDLRLAGVVSGFEVELLGRNLFDEQYSEAIGNDPATFAARGYPMPGRTYSLGVKWVF